MDIIFLPAVWAIFTGCLLWYLIAVKRSEPITVDEAKVLWKIHKKTSHCGGHNWQPIKRRGGKLKGFQCECGYHYSQKRPMLSGTHKTAGSFSQSYPPSIEI
jgi:hypothetical protein